MKNINQPLVSVLVCTYNAEKYIATTLQSITRQTYNNLQILVLDNNSSDNTCNVVRKIDDKRIQLIDSKDNLGPYKGFNFLLDNHARGKYVAVQDHDDLWHTEKIALQVDFLEKNADFVGCGSQTIEYFEAFEAFYLKKRKPIDVVTTHIALLFRNEKKYRYDTEFQFEADHYFMKFVLCEEQPKIYSIQKLLALHRRRSDNANLNTKWFKGFSWRHIQRHYKVTGSLKGTIMFSFNRLFVPDAILMPLKLKMYDFQPLTNMKNDDFLKVFYDFLVVGDNTNNGTK